MNSKLSSRVGQRSNALPIIGKIKIGEKKKTSSGREYPSSIDYFRCTGDYEQIFHRAFGEKPTKLTIAFYSDDFDHCAFDRMELRDGAGRLIAQSNAWIDEFGEWQGDVRYYDEDADAYLLTSIAEDPDIMAKLEQRAGAKSAGWKSVLTLRFLLPGIPSIFGAWELSTSAQASSIPAIAGTLMSVKSAGGTIKGIPMDLIVEKVTSQKPGSKSNYPVLRLVPNVSQENLETLNRMLLDGIANIQRLTLYTPEKIAELSAGVDRHQLQIEAPSQEIELDMNETTFNTFSQIFDDLPSEWPDKIVALAKEGKLNDDRVADNLLKLCTLVIQGCKELVNLSIDEKISEEIASDLHQKLTAWGQKPSQTKIVYDEILSYKEIEK